MKNKASGFLKQIMTVLTAMAKAKTMAIKSKAGALKTRLVILSLLRNKKILMSSISHKLNALMGHSDKRSDRDETEDHTAADQTKAIVLYNQSATSDPTHYMVEEDDGDNKYPDLTHSLFESEDLDFEDPGGSVIDIVKNSKEDNGEEFKLEDEIDRVADLFIRRFHREMWMQKQLSFKRQLDMLKRAA